MTNSIGIIGAGNMGEAFIGAIIGANLYSPSHVYASDVSQERLSAIKATYDIQTTSDNVTVFNSCNMIILAVKPQHMDDILSGIASHIDIGLNTKKLVISIAAGIRIEKIEGHLYSTLPEEQWRQMPIIRVMPNTPALVLKGVSGMSANQYATPEDMAAARSILSAMGTVLEFNEPDLDAVTAMSGSGPAYVFYLAESMIDAGIRLGLTPESSKELTIGTIKGAMALMEKSGELPMDLRRKVTSPGGTTEAAFKVLETQQVKTHIITAIQAAANRSKTLSE
jgi:pyrroline-5-carboxylate reductase